ncbi:MAG: lytic transglycosylase domain-containing protein, partial [Bryobacterales bacterium]|nr:lytic transglycosylase domain-containing protein [Bryobacterales bacterium]
MLIASPVSAAERPASALLNGNASVGKISIVRVDRRTGKLVRNVSPSAALERGGTFAPIPAPPVRITELVEKSAQAHGVDPLLVHSVIQVESNYNQHAVSSKGAEGLMQLMPGT